MDKNTERRHYLNTPITARYVRFHPVSWHRKIGLRAGVIGCRYKGDCGAGFMQVNSGSSCSKYCTVSLIQTFVFLKYFKLQNLTLSNLPNLIFGQFPRTKIHENLHLASQRTKLKF